MVHPALVGMTFVLRYLAMTAKNILPAPEPQKCRVALLLIDVINDMDFPQAADLMRHAEPAARRCARLKRRVKALGIPVIYVNDNFGHWQSDFKKQVSHCLADGVRGEAIVRLLLPEADDFFVLKPKHSGFYSSALDILLRYLGAEVLILAGFAGNLCVLYTANDAYMRDFRLFVPRDCTASEQKQTNDYALEQMEHCLKADIRIAARIPLRELLAGRRSASQRAAARARSRGKD
jgi:nicotinamidase-related amidase